MNEELVSALIGIIKVEGLQEATRQINQFSAGMRKAAKDVAKEMGVADKAVVQHKQTFGEMVQANAAQIRTAGRYLTVFGAALTGVVVKAGKEFIEFQRDAANVSTMLSGTISEVSGQMAVYSSGIKDLSIEFDQSTTTLQKGLYDILSASVAPAQALEVLKVSAEAATAGISTVAVAADAITTILNAYAMEAESAADVSDKLWAIVRRGKITFDEVASSIGAVATTAAMAGLSYKELGAGIATATRAGVEHRRAMTGINAVLLTFLKNTDEQREAAAKFGIELSSLTLKSEGLIGVVQKLAGANELGRRATAEEIVAIFENRRALVALLPILQDVTGYQEDLALMTDSAGLSALAFSKISQTLDFQLGQLGKTLKVMLIDYFEPLIPVIEKIVSIIKSLADTFRDLSPTLKAAISTITLLSGVFMTLSGVILMLAPGIVALAATIGGPALLAVGALAAALIGGGGLVAALVQASSAVRFADQAVSEHIAKMKEARVTYETEQKTMDRLISKYKELRAAVDATTPGTEERTKAEEKLQQVVREIVNIVPEAAVAWDKYGKAIDVNIKTVERSAEIHRQLYDIKQQLRLRDLAEEAANLRKQQQNRDKEIENIRQQIERERGYLEFLAQERERLLNQNGGDDFMAGPQKSVEEFDASWNNMAGTMAGALSPSLEEIEQVFVNTSASISKWTEKLLALNQESLSYNLTVKEMAVHLVDLAERGKISDTELNHLLDTVPKLKAEFNALKSEGVKPVDDSLKTLIFTMADVRNTYATWQDYVDFVTKSAAPATKTWEEELNGLNAEVDAAAEALKRMYESGEEFDLDVRLEAEERLIAAINKRTAAQKNASEKAKKDIDEYYDDLRSNSDWSTDAVIADIERRMDEERKAGREAGAIYEVLANKLVVEQKKASSAYVKIWDDAVSSINRGMEGFISEIVKGNKTIEDAFKDLGNVIVDSFIDAFARSIVEKIGFDSLFKSNILGLSDFFTATIGGIFSAGAGAALAPGTSAAAAYAAGYQGPALASGAFVPEAAAGTVAAEGSAASVGAVVGPAAAAAVAIYGITRGVEELNRGLRGNVDTIEDFEHIANGLTGIAAPGTVMAREFAALGSEVLGLNEGMSNVADRTAEFAAWGSVLPGIGTGLGAVAGAAFGLAENMGIVGHGTSGMENYIERLEDVADGADTAAGAVEELRWLFYGKEGMGAGKGGYLDDILEKPFEQRQEWFQKYVDDLGIYSEEQKNEIRDMMGLYETEAERAAGAARAEFEVAFQRMKTEMWDRRKGHENRGFDLGGWEEAFSAAYDAAARGEGKLRDLYRKELESQTGEWAKTAEEVEAALRAFDAGEKDFADFQIAFDGEEVKNEAQKVGLLWSDAFEEQAKDIDLTDIDLSEVTEKMKEAGYEAGSSYKSGFEEGASGSGILGDVMWDEGVFAEVFAALREAGQIAGELYKEGFSESEFGLAGIQQSLIDTAKSMRVTVVPEDIPELAAGGIVQRRTNIIAGEDGAEAILPLDRLADIMRQSGNGNIQPGGDTKNEYHITVMLPPGDMNGQEYWTRQTRERIMPALERELSRKGKKLGV